MRNWPTSRCCWRYPGCFPASAPCPPREGTPDAPVLLEAEAVSGLPFLLPYPGNGFYRCAQLLLTQAGAKPGRILNYTNMNTAYQLAARGVGALFITPALFDRFLPHLQSNLAFCTLQEPVYSRASVAAYLADSPRLPLIREMIDLTFELILPRLSNSDELAVF